MTARRAPGAPPRRRILQSDPTLDGLMGWYDRALKLHPKRRAEAVQLLRLAADLLEKGVPTWDVETSSTPGSREVAAYLDDLAEAAAARRAAAG